MAESPLSNPVTPGSGVPLELREILEKVYTPEGVEVWWRGGNLLLNWFAPREVWRSRKDEVMALAESLLGQVAT